MMRLAACMLTESGVVVFCPVHDAFMVEGPVDDVQAIVERTQAIMAKASGVVLDGFELRSDVKILMPGERYHDERGQGFFERVVGLLGKPPS